VLVTRPESRARRRDVTTAGRAAAASSQYGLMSSPAGARATRVGRDWEVTTTVSGHRPASAPGVRGGCSAMTTSSSWPGRGLGSRYAVGGSIVHQPSGSPSTVRWKLSTMSLWLRTRATSVTRPPGSTLTVGSTSASGWSARKTRTATGSAAPGMAAGSLAVGSVAVVVAAVPGEPLPPFVTAGSSHARNSPHTGQKSSAVGPWRGHSLMRAPSARARSAREPA
jgi:hypothetical protein